jgi:hypothetical protein
MKIATIRLIESSFRRYDLKVAERSIFNFTFKIQVQVYITSSTYNLKIKIDSDATFETTLQSFIAVGRASLALSRFAATRLKFCFVLYLGKTGD